MSIPAAGGVKTTERWTSKTLPMWVDPRMRGETQWLVLYGKPSKRSIPAHAVNTCFGLLDDRHFFPVVPIRK